LAGLGVKVVDVVDRLRGAWSATLTLKELVPTEEA
jgi:hypothetical protein